MQNESLNDESFSGDARGDSMRSGEVAEKLGAYVDGELSPSEREAIETLLEEDKSCREIVQTFRFLDEAARRETVPSVNAGEWARIWEAIERQKDRSVTPEPAATSGSAQGGKVLHVPWLLRLAAAAAVVALVFVGFQIAQSPDAGRPIAQTQPPSPETPSAEEELDNGEPDEDGVDSIGEIDTLDRIDLIDLIDGEAPDEIREGGVIYRDF